MRALAEENKRLKSDAIMRARMAQDLLDAEQMRNEELQEQLRKSQNTVGSGIEVIFFFFLFFFKI